MTRGSAASLEYVQGADSRDVYYSHFDELLFHLRMSPPVPEAKSESLLPPHTLMRR